MEKEPLKAYKPYRANPKYSVEVLDNFPELKKWLKQISRRKFEDYIFISDYKKEVIRLNFFTKEYQYSISARLPAKINEHIVQTNAKLEIVGESNAPIDDGYLGCTVLTRKPRAGEDWNRGNDLADGKYCEKTWNKIKDDILGYELVKVVRNSEDK